MSKLLATRNAQFPLYAEFVFNFNDWAIDSVDGVKKTFGSTVLLADPAGSVTGLTAGTGMVLDCINMPLGAVITGGELLIEDVCRLVDQQLIEPAAGVAPVDVGDDHIGSGKPPLTDDPVNQIDV